MEKLIEFEVKVTVEEIYYIMAKHELGAFMSPLGEPDRITIKRRTIKKRKLGKPTTNGK